MSKKSNSFWASSRPELVLLIAVVMMVGAMLPQLAPAAYGQGSSAEPLWIFDPSLDIRHVETADLNGDHIKDVIAAEYSMDYYGAISMVWAIDGRTGDTLWFYQVNDGIRSMTIGDINNDGVMDVVAGASYHSSDTPDGRVHAINGVDGSQLWTYYTGSTNNAVTVGNLNGDEYPDVAVGCFDDYIYAINGQTGGNLWSKLIGSMWINAVDAEDVNDDGIDDIGFAHEYLAGWDNFLGVLDGTNGSDIWSDTVEYVVMDVLLDDIDSDGDVEAVFGGTHSYDQGEIFVRDGYHGTPEWSYNLGSLNHTNGNIILRTHDIDEDTDLDLIVGTYLGTHVIYVFEGDADVPLWISDTLDGNTRAMAFGDVTGDHVIDLAAATSDRVQVLDGRDGTKIWYYSVAGTIQDVSCADFDDDGTDEVAAGGGAEHSGTPPDPGKGVWALKTVESPLLWEHSFGEYGNAIAVADLDDDGDEDVIAVCSVDDFAIALDGEDGTELWTWTGTENLYAITAGDFDKSGQADVAVAGNDDRVTAIFGTHGTIMWPFDTPTNQIYRKCLKAADLNGDDYVDVIAGSDDGHVYAINGSTGGELWSAPVGASVSDVVLAQMNASGPLDVVVAVGTGASGEKVVVLDGSDGSLLWDYPAPEGVEHVTAADVTGDNVPDVAAAITPYAPKQIIMINGATHAFIWSEPVAAASNVHSLSSGDLNGDHIPDIVVPGNSTDRKVYALDGADGHELWSFETGGEINCVLVYDVDNDGQNEVVAGSDDQNVYVIDGLTGESSWSYSCADDVMDVKVGDINGNGLPNIACVTFGSDGVVYAFKSLATEQSYVTGDANGDGVINVADIVYLVNFLYRGGDPPVPMEAGDASCDEIVNVADVVYLVNYLYRGGDPPAC
ncbi:MAG: FG-GAP-like repeat-containing protein [Candidatus Zixiibacteriota bacterium]